MNFLSFWTSSLRDSTEWLWGQFINMPVWAVLVLGIVTSAMFWLGVNWDKGKPNG